MHLVFSSTVSLFLLEKQHGQLRSGPEALHVALKTPVVDVFAEFWVAGPVAVLLLKSGLNSSEHMQARVLHEDVVDVQALEDVLVLLDVRHHAGSRGHVVGVVKARLVEGPAVEASGVFHQVRCGWARLVVIGHVRVVLLEVDGEEHLPVVYGIHAAAVQKLGVDVGVDVGEEEQGVHRVLLGYDVHEFDLGRHFRLDAYPGDFHRGVFPLVDVDLILHVAEYVVVVNVLSLLGVIDEQERQDCVFTRLKGVGGKDLQEMVDVAAVFCSKRYDDVNPRSFGDVGHGNDLYKA